MRVHAAGLNIGVVFAVKGMPLLMRLESGLLHPKYGVPGYDFAGEVEAVGTAVTSFRPGDEVYGVAKGTCAEYVRFPGQARHQAGQPHLRRGGRPSRLGPRRPARAA